MAYLAGERRSFEVVRLTGAADEVEAAWLEERRHGIGGSDVAAIMGLSPWTSPLEVWMDKTRRMSPADISAVEGVAMGVELEPVVREMYRRRHPKARVREVHGMLRSLTRPWAQASLDGITSDPELGPGVLEIKTGSSEAAWEDGVPQHYLCQVTHYLSVTGWAFADVAALVGDRGLHYHEWRVMRDEEDVEAVVDAVDRFWADNVEADAMPGYVTSLASEGRALHELYKRSDGEMAPADAQRAQHLAADYAQVSRYLKTATSEKAQYANELKRLVGEHKGILTPDHIVTWVRSEKRDSGIRVRERR